MKYLSYLNDFLKTLTRPFPIRDWYIVLGVSGAAAVILVGLSIYLFVGIQSGFIIAPHGGESVQTVNVSRESLNNVIEKYKVRTLNFETGNYPVPDVSDPAR